MRRWYREIDKPVEDAFKLIDADFDGRVGDADLNNYLTRYLGFHSSELTQIRLARLKKILDTFKRSALDFTDFKRVFQPSSSPVDATVTAGKFFEDSSSWLSNAKQQLGLVISRQFSSLSQAFS
jgi:Ca2+-binding EF-hand superfamily protein